MAITKSSPGRKDWTDFYSAKGGGVLQELFDDPLDASDEVTFSYLLDGPGLLDATTTYPFNWILIPGPATRVRLFHSCFDTGGKLVGINGCRSTAPFKQISLTGAVSSISIPPLVRGREDPMYIPTLAQFLSITEEDDFSALVGKSEDQITDLSTHPNSFWMHPKLFLSVAGPQSIKASEMAILTLLAIQDEDSDGGEMHTENEIGIYNLLIFLWAVEKRWTTPVLTQDTADTPETFLDCEQVAGRLESWRNAPGHNEKDDDDSQPKGNDPKKRKSKHKHKPRKRKSHGSSDESNSGDRSHSPAHGRKHHSKHKARRKNHHSSSDSSSESSVTSRESSPRRRPNPRKDRKKARRDRDPSPSSSSSSSSDSSGSDRSRGGRRPKRGSRKERRRRPRRRSRRSSDSSEDLRVEVMQSLVEMNRFQQKAYKRDSRKKSMLNRLPDEQVKLYTLLSAHDWHDRKPKINSFTEDLLSDRDPERAWNHLETVSRDWPGEVSKTGLIHFLSKGFRASDVDESPGGFTAFMFSSVDVDRKVSRKDRELAIRSVFGEDTVTDEVVRYYAKNDLFLAVTYEDAKNQLRTCLKCLEKLTNRGSIGTDGYAYGIDLLSKHRRKFMKESRRDPQIYIKFVYMLDRVFQNFISRLGAFHRDRDPIQRAKGSLRGSMRADIDQALGGFDSGVIPNLSLPEVISNNTPDETTPGNKKPEKGKGPGRDTKTPDDLADAPSWWSENPEKEAEWKIPSGKIYRDFFTPEHKANFTNWPKFKHHRHPRVPDQKPLCIKYQSFGSCRAGCRLAHVKPSAMDAAAKALVGARFKEIFKIT
jgi:hypothetical protein